MRLNTHKLNSSILINIKSILELDKKDIEIFKKITDEFNSGLINLKCAKKAFIDLSKLTLSNALKLSKIFGSRNFKVFSEKIKPHIARIKQEASYYTSLSVYITQNNNQGGDLNENLQIIIQQMAHLMFDFVIPIMKSVDIVTTAPQANYAGYMLVERNGDENIKENRLVNNKFLDSEAKAQKTATYETHHVDISGHLVDEVAEDAEMEVQEQTLKRGAEEILTSPDKRSKNGILYKQ
jgi:hypothetical protein